MFSIFNGRTSFYQWDVDQKLIINCDIPDYQVHFKNTSDEVCYTLEPYEMDGKTVVNVPNLLLQNSTPIIVWCYVLDKNGNYTIKSKTFAVIERQKPSDYVYTETEVLSFNSKLDKNVGAENAGKALIVGEDGNIVFEDTNMPKPVGKTDAMTQAVGMDETGKLWTQPGASGGSAETWELIASGEMSEAATLTVNKDANGNAFSLKSCTILVTGALSGGSGSYVRFAVTASGATYFVEASLAKENMNTDAKFIFRQGDVPTLTICSKPGTAWQSGTCTVQMALRESDNALAAAQGAVSSLRIGPWSGSAKLGVGCKYALWGVRA